MSIVNQSGRRKQAIARATVTKGTGVIKINSVPLEQYQPKLLRLKIEEPLIIAGDLRKKINISIRVQGGGITGQADAIRNAIGRAIVDYTKDEQLRAQLLEYDRQILVADIRRKETSKPNHLGKARATRQKSYR
ncbi:MAG: 30S ribosomal protein S9 [Candidatus Woesearchaeota archaeon]